MYIDTHSHLNYENKYGDTEQLLAEIAAAGIGKVINVGWNYESSALAAMQAEKYSAARRNLIGSGGREEKIRTYNFPQNRLTDHRIGYTSHNLDGILMGQLEDLIMALQHAEMQERLAEAGMS